MRTLLLGLLVLAAGIAFAPAVDACSPATCPPTPCHVTFDKVVIYDVNGRGMVVPVPNGVDCS